MQQTNSNLKQAVVHDDISTKLMKETIQNIILPITHIINRSFASGIFPDQMKRAKVIPNL